MRNLEAPEMPERMASGGATRPRMLPRMER
jgi:hypothetical protein